MTAQIIIVKLMTALLSFYIWNR